jgi:molecular chaperone DnaK
VNLGNDPLALQRLKEAAEKAKIELSSSQQTDINLPFITADASGPKHLSMSLSRAKLEALVEELVDRTSEPCHIALQDAGLSADEISDVILVGGQTRMPLVQKVVTEIFKREPRHDINPDEAVAQGAAIQAAVLSGAIKDVLLLDVTPLSLGIETLGGVMTALVEKNTTIPTKATQVFSTAEDNQGAVTVHVLQGERERTVDNKSLGRFDLVDIAPAPRGTPQVEVKLDIDTNGILQVSATDKATGKAQSITIRASSGLDEADVQRMIKDAEANAEQDHIFRELVNARNGAEQQLHEARKTVASLELAPAKRDALDTAVTEMTSAIEGTDVSIIAAKSSAIAALLSETSQASQAGGPDASSAHNGTQSDENVVDAEFEEVDDAAA